VATRLIVIGSATDVRRALHRGHCCGFGMYRYTARLLYCGVMNFAGFANLYGLRIAQATGHRLC